MFEDVDWSHRGQYILDKHNITVAQANEALRDPERMVIHPDYSSQSGDSTRIIGFSPSLARILSVIVLAESGHEYGVNAWVSNDKDARIYREGE